MNRYMMIHRLRGPAFLLLAGTLALLDQAGILGWGKSWPLFLILAGVMQLAERAIRAADGGYPPMPYAGAPPQYTPQYPPQPGAPDFRTSAGIPSYPGQPAPYINPNPRVSGNKPEGEQS